MLLLLALLSFVPHDTGLPRTGMWRHGFAVADMNGDGRPDLVFTSPRKQPGPPVIFLNQGSGQWARWETAQFPALAFDYGAVAAADFDGNGTSDLAVASHYRGVIVLLGDGNGTFTAAPGGFTFPASSRESAPFTSRALTVTDWNADGRPDVAALSDGPRPGNPNVQLGVTVYENLGSAWKPARALLSDVIFGDAIAAGDLDGDGLADLVTASHNTNDRRVLRLGSDGALVRRELETLLPAAVVHAADLRDFDGDGRDEAVVSYSATGASGTGLLELLSFPAGSRPARRLWSEQGAEVAAIATGDLNGDGAADLVAALEDGRLLTFRGDGTGSATPDAGIHPPEWRSGCAAYAVRIADLDGDARGEIIAVFAGESSRCASEGGIEVWRTAVQQGPSRKRSVRH
ncbi:MAG TPA: VCBS repeat-containing protein [Thermoanaerobaculia bacterium]|nr:VCBS repeat-containing protein [Thermoanaerobaculia bacterium]